MKHTPRLSVVVPCYNPVGAWKENLVKNFLKARAIENSIELILVNDGSTKNVVAEEIKATLAFIPEIKLVSYPVNKGKGYALREGVKAASGSLIIYTDIDFPYTYESFRKIYESLEESADVAVGVRGEEYYRHLPAARIRISKILRWFIKKFLQIPTDDTQCGLKGFNLRNKEIFLQTSINRYLFDLEFVFLSSKNKLSIKTIEVELRPEVVLSKMNWKILLQEAGNFLKIFLKAL